MKVAIHQPQYLPWLGYFDKMAQVDCFVVLDNVQFKKNEWQNRNRIKAASGWQWLTVPVLHRFPQRISEVRVNHRAAWPRKHLQALLSSYSGTPFFEVHRPFFEEVYAREWARLAELNLATLRYLVEALGNDQSARDTVLTLVLEAQFSMHPLTTFAEAAAAIRRTDDVLNSGANVATIDSVFAARGISSLGSISDFPYAYLRILHTFPDDLDMQLKVSSTSSPLCTVNIWDPNYTPPFSAPDLVGYVDLTGACDSFLPPTASQPWFLEVRDTWAADVGTIEEFEIVLPGPQRCLAADVPIAIPDADGFVYSVVDCSAVVGPYPASDLDGDGFAGETEAHVGTGPLDPCGNDGWPADLEPNNTLDIGDSGSFLFPLRADGSFSKFKHPVPDPDDPDIERWDIEPSAEIDIGDAGALLFGVMGNPPMFGGEPAFGRVCPFPP